MQNYYLCIDLKSFYASVECVERNLDPMTTNLIVADPERTKKTICLAVTPAMKALGVKNRCRVFEIPKNIEYIIAEPRMQLYIDYAAKIYSVYLSFISKEDIHVYSIDEAFIDVTHYLNLYKMTPVELGKAIMDKIFETTGIRATCGIGTNLYLAKIALDITAKHSPDFIGFLDEEKYRETLWEHRPITDFWRIGKGIAKRLEKLGIYTMGKLAKTNEMILYRQFGVDAELLIDHAWGIEPVTMSDIKNYKPRTNCLSSGQVLMHDYNFEDGRIIIKEMTDGLCLELMDKNLTTSSVTIQIGYSNSLNIEPAKGTIKLDTATNSYSLITPAVEKLYKKIVDSSLPIRRVNITFNRIIENSNHQFTMFENPDKTKKNTKIQEAIIKIKKQFGKNSVLKGMDLKENATTIERNKQIGGHKSGE